MTYLFTYHCYFCGSILFDADDDANDGTDGYDYMVLLWDSLLVPRRIELLPHSGFVLSHCWCEVLVNI